MFGFVARARRGFVRHARKVAVGAALVGPAAVASATPPTMPAIDFPIDIASIGTAVVTAGGAILLIVFGVMIGFRLIRRLTTRVTNAV